MNNAESLLRLGFAGTPQFAVPALDALLRSPHRLAAVFTQPDRPAGRGRSLHASPVKAHALLHGIDVRQPETLNSPEAESAFRELDLDALVVVAYGLIFPAALLTIPRLGCFNIHASLLPRWRGAAPIQRALLEGDAVTGVTIMRMEAGLDTGPMLVSAQLPILERDHAGLLQQKLADLGAGLIVGALEAVASGRAHEVPQPETGVTHAGKIDKSEALIDWSADAISTLRRVRAFNPWPVAETRWNGAQLRIWCAELAPDPVFAAPGTVVAASGSGIDVACGRDGLRLLRVQLAGRKPMSAEEFLKSRKLVGARFERA